jgi:membrane protease YdiL (CAAX protease family)
MISLILVGMMLAYLYEKTDSLAAPIIAHSLYNLTVVLIALAFGW